MRTDRRPAHATRRRAAGGLAMVLILVCRGAGADDVAVGVASNFVPTARVLATLFEQRTGHAVRISSGSTGVLFAQAVNGAPYDVLLLADVARAEALEREGKVHPGARFAYATGRLVLWSANPVYARRDCEEALRALDFERLAIANPRLAPYGVAARQTLQALGLWERTRGRLARGQNVAQTLQFVHSGSASMGLLALSLVRVETLPPATCHWEVPGDLHEPIEQQGVLLARASDRPAAHAFVAFLHGGEARSIIEQRGYLAPGPALQPSGAIAPR